MNVRIQDQQCKARKQGSVEMPLKGFNAFRKSKPAFLALAVSVVLAHGLLLSACGRPAPESKQVSGESSPGANPSPELPSPPKQDNSDLNDSREDDTVSGKDEGKSASESPSHGTDSGTATSGSSTVTSGSSTATSGSSSVTSGSGGVTIGSEPETGATDCPAELPARFDVGFSDHCLKVGDLKRIYRVYLPQGGQVSADLSALVLVLHGGGGSAANSSDPKGNALAVFRQVADRENFLLVYPQGTEDQDQKNGWNDCRTDDVIKSPADDVGFLESLILKMQSKFDISPAKTFMSGTSNGAMMTFRFMLEKSTLLGAVATSSGNIAAKPMPGRCTDGPEKPLPILMTHGTKDPIVPTNGGYVACLNPGDGSRCQRGTVKSMQETVDFWLKVVGLQDSQPRLETRNVNSDDSGDAVKRSYFKFPNLAEAAGNPSKMVSWQLNDAGHTVPSLSFEFGNRIVGAQNRDIEFAEEAWLFFESHLR